MPNNLRTFQIPIRSLQDYSDFNYPIFYYADGRKSSSVLHISLSPIGNNELTILFWSSPNLIYRYHLNYPVQFIRDFEQKVLEFNSLGMAFVFFKKHRSDLAIFQKKPDTSYFPPKEVE
jgi:hypothetical protein